jgi:dimethylamine/trimethylamine dehydrogenase
MPRCAGVKASGGWAVLCTEQAEIHHSSEITPFIELRLWDDADMPMLTRIADAIHDGGALAGIELCYNGMNGPNLYSREVPLGPMNLPILTFTNDPVQARAMDREDIRNLRRWHRAAAIRAKQAGFDLVYVYGAHGFGAVQHFLSRLTNQRNRRVRRLARKPRAAAEGIDRGHQGCDRRFLRRAGAASGR